MGASVVAFALLVLLAPLAAQYLAKDPSLTYLFILYGLVVLANLISESSTGLLQIFDRFRPVAILGLIGNIVTLALVTFVYLFQGGLLGVLVAYLIGKAVGALGLSLVALVESGRRWGKDWWRLSLQPIKPHFHQLTRFAVSTNISASVSLITKDSELLWVSLFRGPVETGYYRLALTLTNLVQMPVSPLPQATYPELSRQAARGEWLAMRHLLRQGSFLAGGYTLVATIFLLIFGKPLIAWLYSPEFLPAYPAMVILLLGYLVANTFYWRRSALLALGRADYPAKVNLILAAIKMVGILLLVPRYGYLACAALLAGFYWIGSFFTVLKVYTLLPRESQAA
jgi:O-antigen/teichoic acid export membrane protein